MECIRNWNGEERLRALGPFADLTALMAAFSSTSAIALAILDNQRRYLFVNDALVAMHNRAPAEAFIGSTFRDILEDAAPETEVRFQRVSACEMPAMEVTLKLPSRTEVGYWVEKNFAIAGRSGRVIQIASLAVEVTADRKLEECFRKAAGKLLSTIPEYQRLGRELHESINEYHAALGMSLDRLSRCTRDADTIPELLAQSTELLDGPMRKVAAVVGRCFPLGQQH